MKQVKKWILGGLLVLMLTATASASQKLTKEELESIINPPCSGGDFVRCFSGAEAGHIASQSGLGDMFRKGNGVAQNFVQAVKWYRRAAAAGDKDAQYWLGVMYFNGAGIQKDYRFAYMWLDLAGYEKKYGLAGALDERIIFRSDVASRMTSAQIIEADKMSKQCLARNYKGC